MNKGRTRFCLNHDEVEKGDKTSLIENAAVRFFFDEPTNDWP